MFPLLCFQESRLPRGPCRLCPRAGNPHDTSSNHTPTTRLLHSGSQKGGGGGIQVDVTSGDRLSVDRDAVVRTCTFDVITCCFFLVRFPVSDIHFYFLSVHCIRDSSITDNVKSGTEGRGVFFWSQECTLNLILDHTRTFERILLYFIWTTFEKKRQNLGPHPISVPSL